MAQAAFAGPVSSVATRIKTQSERLWDLDWRTILPWPIDDDVTIEHATFDDALPFIRAHYGQIFGAGDGRFVVEPMSAAKERFGADMDVFVYRSKALLRERPEGDGICGVCFCHPTDWSTYYMRSAAFLREFRGRHYGTVLTTRICDVLRDAGVGRVEVETSPTNAPTLQVLMNLGFVVTSMSTSERWGTLVRYTKFLDAALATSFARQLCWIESTHRAHKERSGP